MAATVAGTSWTWPSVAAAAVVGINVFDLCFTLVFLQLGLCTEANPFMRAMYACSPWVFAAVKLTLVNAAVMLLVKLGSRPAARAALFGITLVYVTLAAYELSGLAQHLPG